MVKYAYDAWGMCQTTVVDPNASTIATLNPFRYRSYYLDTETNLYFLKTRYYDPEIGRFMTIDDLSYLDPESINGLNLYAYCGNNPVMGYDPNGTWDMPKWLAWTISGGAIVGGLILCATGRFGILGGILIGAGAGSLINGYVSDANGGSFTAGYIGGVISGALCGVGAGLGGLAFSVAAKATNLASTSIGYLSLGALASFAGGFAGNLASTVYTNWHNSRSRKIDINWRETFNMSAIMGALNIFAGIGSGIASIVGTMGKVATDMNSKLALQILAGSIAGGTEFFYDLISYLISKLISQF